MDEIPTKINLTQEQLEVYEACLTILSEVEDTILLALGLGIPGVVFTRDDALYMVNKSLEAINIARNLGPDELEKLAGLSKQDTIVVDNVISFEEKQKNHKDKGFLN